ncbi:unnamed protein product [Durusdinium trenchii]|uniref:Uncharacterized protein n=1 Tax=Durusdinium trenchii TaxID=1381693 RepID=A0ABP0KN98_9DINO
MARCGRRWWFWALLVLPRVQSQGPPVAESQLPAGLRQWIGLDFCGEERWVQFHGSLSEVVGHFNNHHFPVALRGLAELLATTASAGTEVAFGCATAVMSALALAAQCCEQLQLPTLATRFRQLSAIFGSYDYQMKGEDYIDQSPWPINWKQNMEGILRSMAFLKQQELQAEPWRGLPARAAAAQFPRRGSQRIAIVTVCDYDPTQTPLARLSKLNRDAYARLHGYDIIMYDQAPLFTDGLTYLTEKTRPPAWSKVDALLETLAKGQHDWVMWLDCDSFFMDSEVRLEDLLSIAESRCPADAAEGERLEKLVSKWRAGPQQAPDDLLEWYDNLLDSYISWDEKGCDSIETPVDAPSNRSLGRYCTQTPSLRSGMGKKAAQEVHLFVRSSFVWTCKRPLRLARASVWSWAFFQKVRWMTFGRSPVTQHPWWEQTAMATWLQSCTRSCKGPGAFTDPGAGPCDRLERFGTEDHQWISTIGLVGLADTHNFRAWRLHRVLFWV